MDYAGMRELVRLRYELRRLLAERPPGADAAARGIICQIEALVAHDAEAAAVVASPPTTQNLTSTVKRYGTTRPAAVTGARLQADGVRAYAAIPPRTPPAKVAPSSIPKSLPLV